MARRWRQQRKARPPVARELDLGGEDPSTRAQVRGHLVEMKASRSEVSWRYRSWGGQSAPAALVAWPLAFVAALALVIAGVVAVALVVNGSSDWTPVYVFLGIGVAALGGAAWLAVHRRRPGRRTSAVTTVEATVLEVSTPAAAVAPTAGPPHDAATPAAVPPDAAATPGTVAPDGPRVLPPAGPGPVVVDGDAVPGPAAPRTGPVRDTPLP